MRFQKCDISINFFPFSVSNITIFFSIHMLSASVADCWYSSVDDVFFWKKKRPWLRKRVSHANAMESPAHVRRIMISFFFHLSSLYTFFYILSFESFVWQFTGSFQTTENVFFFSSQLKMPKKKKLIFKKLKCYSSFSFFQIFWLVGSLVTCWQQLASFREIGNYTQHDDDAASSSSTFHKFIFFFGGKLFSCLCVIFRRD